MSSESQIKKSQFGSSEESESLFAGDLTPREIVAELDKFIVGQEDAKKCVAIALRNRARRRGLSQELQEDIYPKNILMIGPTGVGKTEIARRLAKIADAPFYKVEASKFTEVGYVGRDVESMIRDLVEISVNDVREYQLDECMEMAETFAEDRLLDLLLPSEALSEEKGQRSEAVVPTEEPATELLAPREIKDRLKNTREKLRKKLRAGELEDKLVEMEVKDRAAGVMGFFPPGSGFEEVGIDLQDMFERMMPSRKKRKKMTVGEARPLIEQDEANRLLDMDAIVREALTRVEDMGIIFLDEIDKIVNTNSRSGPDVSREGVQRDLLPLVEGCAVFTKYGVVRTDHILFIAAGAFHSTKPSELIPELQGRFPIRVELESLTEKDFQKILTEPQNSLLVQYRALMETEGLRLEFSKESIESIAHLSYQVNEETENIGARRLHTMVEKLLEDISFEAPEIKEKEIVISPEYVQEKLADLVKNADLSRYIL